MDEDKILEGIEKANKSLEAFKKTLGEKLDKSEMEAVTKQLEELKNNLKTMQEEKVSDAVKSINDSLAKVAKQVEEIQGDMSVMKDKGNGQAVEKSFGQQVVEKLRANKVTAESFKTQNRPHEVYELTGSVNKVAGTFTTANVTAVGTNAIPFSLAQYEAGLTRIVTRRPWILDIANVSTTDKKYVQWAEQANRDGAANETAEGNDKNQIDFDWVEKSARVEKITAYIKVSKEALDDLDGLANEIDMELREMVLLKVDADLLAGDGTTPSLNGLLNQDTAYSAGSFAGTIVSPNKADVIRTAIAQVVGNLFIPNYALLHPDDLASMDLDKGSDGHYVLPPFKSADGTVISGVKLLANTGQTVDKFTVGDFTKFNVRVRQGMTVDIGHNGDDFIKNLLTILGEMRLTAYVKTNHVGAFVSGDFSDAIAALDAGS